MGCVEGSSVKECGEVIRPSTTICSRVGRFVLVKVNRWSGYNGRLHPYVTPVQNVRYRNHS